MLLSELTRSQIRAYIAKQTGESLEELRKLKQQLRAKAYSKGSTPQDRKMVSVASDMLKKMEKEERARKTAATAEKKGVFIYKLYTFILFLVKEELK